MKHFVAYHSVERMGEPYGVGFGFWSGKRRSYLEKSVGNKVWVIEGDSSGRRPLYSLRASFVVSGIARSDDDDGHLITGERGTTFGDGPVLLVNGRAWFEDLFREQNHFSFGFNEIRDKGGKIVEGLLAEESTWLERDGARASEDADDVEDARRRIRATIVARQGQAEFRRALLDAYEARCAITGWDVEAALEAAHIRPYRGPHTNRVSNGLLLRGDLHTLFDLGLIAVDSKCMRLIVASALSRTQLAALHGAPLRLPRRADDQPDVAALDEHRARARLD